MPWVLSHGDPNTFRRSHSEQGPPEAEPVEYDSWQTAKLCRLSGLPLANLWSLPTKCSHASRSKLLLCKVQIPRSYPAPKGPINNPTAGPGLIPRPGTHPTTHLCFPGYCFNFSQQTAPLPLGMRTATNIMARRSPLDTYGQGKAKTVGPYTGYD